METEIHAPTLENILLQMTFNDSGITGHEDIIRNIMHHNTSGRKVFSYASDSHRFQGR